MQKKYLITSTGRTATKFLANYFAEHTADTCSHHITKHSRLFNILINIHLNFNFNPVLLNSLWRRLKSKEFSGCDKNIFIDSNNLLYALPLLLEDEVIYDGVIHITRDPREYVRSHLNWSKNKKKSWIADRLIPFWQPNGWLMDDINLIEWFSMDRFERFCWIWKIKNRLISTIANIETTTYLSLRYEDLFHGDKSDKTFNSLNDFIGVPPSHRIAPNTGKQLNSTNNKVLDHWQNWSPQLCTQLDKICGEDMRKYHYGSEDSWRAKVRAYL